MSDGDAAERRPSDFEAILRSVDPEQPVDTEIHPDGADVEEARVWTRVYRELLHMEQGVLQAIHDGIPHLGDEARREVEATNLPLIKAQLDRFRWRLGLWESRLRELEPGEPGS